MELGMFHRQWADRTSRYDPCTAAVAAMGLAALGLPAVDYWELERNRARYQREYNRLLKDDKLDAIVLPGAVADSIPRSDPATPILSPNDVPMVWANYAGVPVIALPVGRSDATGIPFGVQLGGYPWAEAKLIALALELQAAEPSWRDIPSLSPNPRVLPETALGVPGAGPDPTNVDAAAP
ncbi:amidase family protein, partial [Nocardia gipuzkoensis]